MITLKELENVTKYPRQAPFPGEEYAKEIFKKMKELLILYEKYFKGKEYSIIFSDSEEIDFEILDKNICHMLGLEYTNFFNGDYYRDFLENVLNVDSKPTSYEWVKLLLENSDEVINYDKNTPYQRAINYFKCKIKCSIFEKLSELEEFNFGKLQSDDDTKLLYTQSNEPICPYFLARLKSDNAIESDERRIFIINSLLAPKYNELKDYFEQEASIPTQIMIDGNNDVSIKNATSKQKIHLLNQYKSIILDSGNNNKINIYGDYISSLSREVGNCKIK